MIQNWIPKKSWLKLIRLYHLKSTVHIQFSKDDFNLFFLVSSSKKTAVLPSNSVSATDKATIVQQKPKIKSYKNLLKLAKAVTPAGLISAPSSNTQAKEIFPDQSKNRETMQISVKNPHHPDYRPPSSNNVSSSMAFRNIPKSKMISTKKFKVASKSSSKIPNDLIMLNTKKRDLATVEEIQEELLKKKHYSGNDVGRQQTTNEIESNGRLEKRVDPLLKILLTNWVRNGIVRHHSIDRIEMKYLKQFMPYLVIIAIDITMIRIVLIWK
jgi:hypothetical protein